eukprot:1441168-Rhodomonas_salina.1
MRGSGGEGGRGRGGGECGVTWHVGRWQPLTPPSPRWQPLTPPSPRWQHLALPPPRPLPGRLPLLAA